MEKPGAVYNDSSWQLLYKIGGWLALISVAIVPIQMFVFMTSPPPDTVGGWFSLFQENRLLGLLAFEGLFIFDAVLGVPTLLALYIVLRRRNESLMLIALALGIIGTVSLIVARPAFEMLFLSAQLEAATSEAQRTLILAAGEAMRAISNGSAFTVSYNLANINLLIIPAVMLQSKNFSKAAAIMGILASLTGFGLYLPQIGLFLGILSALFLAIWKILVGLRLLQLGRATNAQVYYLQGQEQGES